MTGKTAQDRSPATRGRDAHAARAQVDALQAELAKIKVRMAQKDLLLDQGFQVFNRAAEKLEEAQKRNQEVVAALNLEIEQQNRELDRKNKELERNLIERDKVKNYLSNILESLAIGVFVTDLDGGVTSVNRAGLDLLDVEAEALLGQNVNAVLGADLLPRDRKGRTSLETHVEFDEPVPHSREDGETLQLRVSITPMKREEGEKLGYIFNVQDVTLLKKLQEHAERRNRFTAMGEMAANIAHEIRNPLGSIELFASLVRKGLPPEDEKLELMNHISNGIASMNHIISNLLEYTKPKPVALQKMDLHQLLQEVVEFTRFSAQQNQVEIQERLAAKQCWIKGDPELLRQVFHNLILNGVQAMPEGGLLGISTASRTLTNAKLLSRLGENPAPGGAGRQVVEVAVKDTGTGMAPEIRRSIFDPFFTTKARGTGLGLAIVHNIVEAHRGLIDVENGKERGTTFVLMFPAING